MKTKGLSLNPIKVEVIALMLTVQTEECKKMSISL